MNVPRNALLRELEIFRALTEGTQTYSDLLRASGYENMSSVRRLVQVMLDRKQVKTWIAKKPRTPGAFVTWKVNRRACHFALTEQGTERLKELEAEYAARQQDATG